MSISAVALSPSPSPLPALSLIDRQQRQVLTQLTSSRPAESSSSASAGAAAPASSGHVQETAELPLNQAISGPSTTDFQAAATTLQDRLDNPAVNQASSATAGSQFAESAITQASRALGDALQGQQFSVFALQLQANAFALTNALLTA